MKPLLKAGDAQAQAAVRHFASRADSLSPTTRIAGARSDGAEEVLSCPAPSEEAQQIARLEQEIASLRSRLEEEAESAGQRETEAFERGVATGLERAASRDDQRLAALGESIAKARAALADGVARLEILSLEIAQTALARIFGDETLYAGMVAAALRHQLGDLAGALAISARVSPADFPDEQALATLAAEHPQVDLRRDPALAAGECRIDLGLGRLDAGIAGQWARLSALLDDLAREGAEA